MSLSGQHLMPWQADFLKKALATDSNGYPSSFRVGLAVPRQNGKGTVLEAAEMIWLLSGERVLHSAHLFKTSMEAFDRLLACFESHPDLKAKIHDVKRTRGFESIWIHAGKDEEDKDRYGIIEFITRSSGNARGLSADKVVYDEAYALKSEHIDAAMPVLITRPNAQVWFTSTPPLDTISGQPFFELRDMALAEKSRICWADWGSDPDVDTDDPAEWAKSNPSLGVLTDFEKLGDLRDSMSPEGFLREILGSWPTSIDHARISSEAWAALEDKGSQIDGDVVLTIEVAIDRSSGTICAYGRRADGLGHVEVVEHQPGTKWIPEALRRIADAAHPIAIGVDGRSPAAALLMDLERKGFEIAGSKDQATGKLHVLKTQDVTSACGQFIDAVLDSQSIRHIGQPILSNAIPIANERPVGDGVAWGRRIAGADIQPVVGVTNARYLYESFTQRMREEYSIFESIGF